MSIKSNYQRAVNDYDQIRVMPQLRLEILSPESGWSLRRKLEAARLSDEPRRRYP